MRVLFITSLLKGGGAEVFLYELTKGLSELKKEGIDIGVSIVSGSPIGVSDYTLLNTKVKVYIIPNTKFYFQEWLLGLASPSIEKNIKKVIRNERPDIIHLNNFLGPAVISACQDVGIPVIVTVHDYWPLCPKTTLVYIGKGIIESPCRNVTRCLKNYRCIKFLKILPPHFNYLLHYRYNNFREKILDFLRSSVVIAVSNYLKGVLEKQGLSNVRVIYNGRTFKEISFSHELWKRRNFILYLGGPRFEKGFHVVMALLKSVTQNHEVKNLFSSYVFVIRGEKVNINHVGLRLKISNFFHNIEDYFKKSFITLIPSIYHEPLPYTAIEAIAYGSIVLAFNVGGIREIVLDDLFLVEPNNMKAFYEKFVEIMKSDKEFLYKKLEVVRNHVIKTFNAERMVKDYYDLYARLAK